MVRKLEAIAEHMVSFGVIRLILVATCSLVVAGCATSLIRGTPKTVQEYYDVAREDLEDGLYPEAISGFTELKTKYPYSKLAALADLGIADTHFERGKFIEAIDAYRSFLKFHPSHPEASYAMFRIGEAYYEQIPNDWWFLPPSAEKDQASTRMAISAFRDMLARYPKSENADEARKRLDESRRKLANHEMYVARFYFTRGRYAAAVSRANGLVRDYPGLGLDAEALMLAARAHRELGDEDKTRTTLQRLKSEQPDSVEAAEAINLLDELGSREPPHHPRRLPIENDEPDGA